MAAALVALLAPRSAEAGQALSSRETQRLLKVADDAMTSARSLLATGKKREARTRLGEAEQAYTTILDANPLSKDGAVGLSSVYFLTRRYADGVKLMTPFRQRLEGDHDVAHQLGLHLYRDGQLSNAIVLLEEVAADEGRFDASWILAVHYYRSAAWKVGLPHVERYVAAQPDDTRALALLGTYQLKTGLYEASAATLERYLESHPDNTAARINYGNALFRKGDLDAASAVYEPLLQANPDRQRLIYNLAAIRMKQGRCEDAVELLDRFLQRDDDHGTALYFKADCLVKLRRYEQARETFQKASAGGASNPWIFHGLSRIAFEEGRLEEAVSQARKAVDVGPTEWELANWLGTLLRKTGKLKLALQWHDKAITLKPDEAAPHVERGRDLWGLDALDDALASFSRGLELNPEAEGALSGVVAVRTARGVRARLAGDAASATSEFTAALDAMPGYEPPRVNLALMALGDGDLQRAGALLENAPKTALGADHAAALALYELRRQDFQRAAEALRLARKMGTRLEGLVEQVDAQLAARQGDWDKAARHLDRAHKLEPGGAVAAARAHAWLEVGVQRLARGEADAAAAALDKADAGRADFRRADRATLDLARAALGVVSGGDPQRKVQALEGLIRSRRYAGAGWAQLRDVGQTYVAYGYLRANDPIRAIRALDRIRRPRALDGAAQAMRAFAEDLMARRAFNNGDFGKAAQLWSKQLDKNPQDGAIRHNLAAARFATGDLAESEATWESLAGNGGPAEALYNLANAADRRGDYRRAYDYYKRFAESGVPGADRARDRVEAKQRVFGFGQGGAP